MNNDYKDYDNRISFEELCTILSKNVPIIRNITICTIFLAGLYLFFASPVYESRALLRIKPNKGIASSLLDESGNSVSGIKFVAKTYSEILKSKSVLEPVIVKVVEPNENGKYPSYEEFSKRITVVPIKDSEIIEVSFKAKTAKEAQAINQLVLESFMKKITDLVRNKHSQTRSFIEERLMIVKSELEEAERRLNGYVEYNIADTSNSVLVRDIAATKEIYWMLAKRLEEAKVAEVSVSTEVQIIDMPTLPEKRKSPARTMTVIIATFIGLLSGCTLVIARELLNRTIKTSDDIEKYLGLPVLGKIPSSESINEVKNKQELNIWQKVWRKVWKK